MSVEEDGAGIVEGRCWSGIAGAGRGSSRRGCRPALMARPSPIAAARRARSTQRRSPAGCAVISSATSGSTGARSTTAISSRSRSEIRVVGHERVPQYLCRVGRRAHHRRAVAGPDAPGATAGRPGTAPRLLPKTLYRLLRCTPRSATRSSTEMPSYARLAKRPAAALITSASSNPLGRPMARTVARLGTPVKNDRS